MKFEIGDTVEVIPNSRAMKFEIGDTVEVIPNSRGMYAKRTGVVTWIIRRARHPYNVSLPPYNHVHKFHANELIKVG